MNRKYFKKSVIQWRKQEKSWKSGEKKLLLSNKKNIRDNRERDFFIAKQVNKIYWTQRFFFKNFFFFLNLKREKKFIVSYYLK
jgi:hypothetical protein